MNTKDNWMNTWRHNAQTTYYVKTHIQAKSISQWSGHLLNNHELPFTKEQIANPQWIALPDNIWLRKHPQTFDTVIRPGPFSHFLLDNKAFCESNKSRQNLQAKAESRRAHKTVTYHSVWSYDLWIGRYYSLFYSKRWRLIRPSTMARLEARLDTSPRRVVFKISSLPVILLLSTPTL